TSFFFFSSRRRHTRFSRDWSSDVCSSDLKLNLPILKLDPILSQYFHTHNELHLPGIGSFYKETGAVYDDDSKHTRNRFQGQIRRSEERRVGKEGRYRRLKSQS